MRVLTPFEPVLVVLVSYRRALRSSINIYHVTYFSIY